jgi:hypothetical protein
VTYGGDSGNRIFVLYWRCPLIKVSVIRGSTVLVRICLFEPIPHIPCRCRGLFLYFNTHNESYTHTHTLGSTPRASDRLVPEASTYTHIRNKRKNNTSMHPAGLEPAITAIE